MFKRLRLHPPPGFRPRIWVWGMHSPELPMALRRPRKRTKIGGADRSPQCCWLGTRPGVLGPPPLWTPAFAGVTIREAVFIGIAHLGYRRHTKVRKWGDVSVFSTAWWSCPSPSGFVALPCISSLRITATNATFPGFPRLRSCWWNLPKLLSRRLTGSSLPCTPSPLDSGFRRSDDSGGCFHRNRSSRLPPAHKGTKMSA